MDLIDINQRRIFLQEEKLRRIGQQKHIHLIIKSKVNWTKRGKEGKEKEEVTGELCS